MLYDVMSYCKNWFVTAIHKGRVLIDPEDKEVIYVNDIPFGEIANPFTSMVRIVGGHTNYELLTFTDPPVADQFTGELWELSPPQEFLDLVDKIVEWYAENKPTNYTSESFGGYSYSKATDDKGRPLTWHSVFAKELKKYKKI